MAIYYYRVIFGTQEYQEISSSKSELTKAWNKDKKSYKVSDIKKRIAPIHEVFIRDV